MAQHVHIGTSALRKEGRAKLMGTAQYTDDKTLPAMLHGVTVRAPVPRGRIKKIEFLPGVPWEEITVVSAKDLEAWGFPNEVASIINDQPFLADQYINHAEEAVLLLAHQDRYVIEQARKLVRIEVDEQPAVLDIQSSIDAKEIVWGKDNVIKQVRIRKGDPDSVWNGAAHVLEGEYHTGAQEHAYLEPSAVIAEVNPADKEQTLRVWGSLQCPYFVHKSLVHLFKFKAEQIRVVQMETGGGFGGKEDYPSLMAGHAALLAWKSGLPVKILYDREEDMSATTKRHPSRTHIRSAFDAMGRLLALDIDFVLDAGAYATMSPVVLSRGSLHAAGVYRCPHTRIRGRAVATNTPSNGAFRGFGAPQSLFAMERHMDQAAARMGMDPVELRRKNFLKLGDTMATGQVIRENVDLEGLMEQALREIRYYEKRQAYQALNQTDAPIKKGVGFSVVMHGAGFTGSGETNLASVAGLQGTKDGRIEVLAASTELGQGKNTVFAQIAAEALNIPLGLVDVVRPDTGMVPDSGPTAASRSTMIVGRLIQDAAHALKQTLLQAGELEEGYGTETFQQAVKQYLAAHGSLKAYSQYQKPSHIHWDDVTYQGDAYPTYSWACYSVDLSLDMITYEVKVDDFVAVQEVGRVINPTLAVGQIEGGVAQGLGWALWEDVHYQRGRMINSQFTNYIIPGSEDLPRIRVAFQELPYAGGPSGAKGIGELPMDGPAPTVLSALQHATGILELNRVPMTPERILDAVETHHG